MNVDRVEERRIHVDALRRFVVANAILVAINGYGYVAAAGGAAGTPGWAFATVALFEQAAVAMVLVGLILLAVAQLRSGYRLVPFAAAAAAAFVNLFVWVDDTVFGFFRFHVNALVVGNVWSTTGLQALHVRPAHPAALLACGIALLAGERLVFAWCIKRSRARPLPPSELRRQWGLLLAGIATLVVADRAVYAIADLRNYREVTRVARVIPLYQPFTMTRWFRSHTRVQVAAPAAPGLPNYPFHPLRFRPVSRRPNVVWLVLDSWRADAFDPLTSPEAWRLGEHAQVFAHHVSGGNCTRFGMFSMFYGLYGSGWRNVVGERRGPVLLAAIRSLGYRMRLMSTAPLTEFRQTDFVEVQDVVVDEFPGNDAAHKDRKMTAAALRFLDAQSPDRPFFLSLLFESTHAPYAFDPRVAMKAAPRGAAADTTVNHLPLRYRDAVHYADGLVGAILRTLERRHLLGDTIVVVTGDHGEEFNEHGFFGHATDFSAEQTQVPLVLSIPGSPPARHTGLTSHEDLVPTLLELIGVENPPSDYSVGRSLLSGDADAEVVSCGWDECAVIDPEAITVFGTETYEPTRLQVRDAGYRPVPETRAALARRSRQLISLLARESVFLR